MKQSVTECICCQEIKDIKEKCDLFNKDNDTGISCITEHPGFPTVVLDIYVLEAAYHQYKQNHGKLDVKSQEE